MDVATDLAGRVLVFLLMGRSGWTYAVTK